MADEQKHEGPSTSTGSEGRSESIVNINIKTLDSQNHAFEVDSNMQVSAFKEKVATRLGVPVAQQRLIFRGKALMDDHLLSEYNLEHGDTLHLVIRQPSQPQFSATASNGESAPSNGVRGQEPTTSGPRARVGHFSQSVVLGTFNVGDQGQGLVPDLNRVIGEALSSIGLGNQIGVHHPGMQVNAPNSSPQGNEAQNVPRNSGSQNQHWQPGQPFPSQSGGIQIPIGAAIAIPSLMPIPDSLHTLTEFMNHMESVLSHNASQPNQSTVNSSGTALPTNSRGQSTPETLSMVLRHSERLVGSHVTSALSRIAGRLEQDGNSTDLTVRGQIQAESVQLGLAMQHLGAQFLELGRTMLTLRMGQSPAESSVNAGPAVYISPSGPNPIMVQPFPLQTYSLFGGSTSGPPNPIGGFSPFGIGHTTRNVNIHIHTVGARPTNLGGTEGDQASGTGSGDSSQSRAPPRTNAGAADPSRAHMPFSGASQAGQPESTTVLDQSMCLDAETGTRKSSEHLQMSNEPNESAAGGFQGMNHSGSSSTAPIGLGIGDLQPKKMSNEPNESAAGGSQGMNHSGGSSTIPIGLGIGDLQPKRRIRQSKSQASADIAASSSSQDEQFVRDGQQILQSLASLNPGLPSHPARGTTYNSSFGGNEQPAISNVMSQVLQSPALSNLLGGISQQTALGSPDALRNMMQQVTQSPGLMNTVNQIAQQIDPQDLGSMISGLRVGQGGGSSSVDFSSMLQQLMPLVSQALGGASIPAAAEPAPRTEIRQSDIGLTRDETMPTDQSYQTGLQDVARRIENGNPPEDIFRSIVENAVQAHPGGSSDENENLVNDLCSTEGLANEFMEVLQQDVSRRLRDEAKPPRKP
ncbi:hypothetical protein DM860_016893 [Cuscuta australis]|uniref:Ubiquitin-like domain-containing protein n=1 Tax=Cuscuta australis TaxID=267555 RepID=A0A328DYW8_9ASTE|nr:hypothetical protein DM860_016893 [Cuscuta australis]